MKVSFFNRNQILGMKAVITLYILFTAPFSSFSTDEKVNDWTREKLKGEVKTLREITYSPVNKKRIFKRLKTKIDGESYKKVFSKEGNKTEEITYNYEGSLDFYVIYKYDENQNIIEFCEYSSDSSLKNKWIRKYDSNQNLIESNKNGSFKQTYKYDDKGNRIERIFLENNSLATRFSYRETYRYDDKGNKTERYRYSLDDSIILKETYKYDEKRNMIEWNYYRSSEDSLTDRKTYKYDDNGNQIEYNYTSFLDSSFNKREVTKYDEKGNIIENITYNRDGNLVSTSVFIYNNKGNLIETKLYSSNGGLDQRKTYHYDKVGNLVSWISFDGFDKRKCEYKFDKKGNWIKKIEFENGKLLSITEREIEYY